VINVRVATNGRWFRVEVGFGCDTWQAIEKGTFPTQREAEEAAVAYYRKHGGTWFERSRVVSDTDGELGLQPWSPTMEAEYKSEEARRARRHTHQASDAR
jgi:hypothetical protein